jgi:hypothetical protein
MKDDKDDYYSLRLEVLEDCKNYYYIVAYKFGIY